MMKKTTSGFTIVELLIVIIVMAILASISIAAYNGITTRAISSEKAEKARRIKIAFENFATINGYYPRVTEVGGGGATGAQAATFLGLKQSDLEPTGYAYPNFGLEGRGGTANSGVTGFMYTPFQYSNGVGFTCEVGTLPDNCQSYMLSYWDKSKNIAVTLRGSL